MLKPGIRGGQNTILDSFLEEDQIHALVVMALSQQLQDLLNRKAPATGAVQMAWRSGLEHAIDAGLPESAVLALTEAAADPRQLNEAIRALLRTTRAENRPADAVWSEFVQVVDESDYALDAWTAGLDRFFAWLQRQGRATDWRNAVGYLHCCAMAEPGSPLPALVDDMLDRYGFEGGDPDRTH